MDSYNNNIVRNNGNSNSNDSNDADSTNITNGETDRGFSWVNNINSSSDDKNNYENVVSSVTPEAARIPLQPASASLLPPSMMLDPENLLYGTLPTSNTSIPVVVTASAIAETHVQHHNSDIDECNTIPMVTATALSQTSNTNEMISFRLYQPVSSLPNSVVSILQSEHGFPLGLASELANTRAKYPVRFWILDNSGSMRQSDGQQLRLVSDINKQKLYSVIPCTRWTELQGTAECHIRLSKLLETTTYFRLLNDPGPTVGKQEFLICDPASSNNGNEEETSKNLTSNTIATTTQDYTDVEIALSTIRGTTPSGVTPLCDHIQEIYKQIQSVESQLRHDGQQAVVVIATDGLPTDLSGNVQQEELARALKQLQQLPVWIVIRLCTNSDDVVQYYNELDSILELQLEVLDDYFAEGREIRSVNKWLTYGLPLHRVREMGYQHRIFDLLDERLLNKDELFEFVSLLFGVAPFRDAPNLHVDWKGFVRVLEHVVKAEGKIYSPHNRKFDYWINIKQLNRSYGDRWSSMFWRKRR